jgi:hypothetical protein
MLIEAWHHVLKGKFLEGKRNRRMDHLVSCLVEDVVPYYRLKQRRQDIGMEGDDLELQRRRDVIARANQDFTIEDIEVLLDLSI